MDFHEIKDRKERAKRVELYINICKKLWKVENLPAWLMEEVTDSLLYEELTDRNPHKVSSTEYPFLSQRQIFYRLRREAPLNEDISATDGKKYTPPVRRELTPYEEEKRGEIISRNKERREKYKQAIKPSEIITYYVRGSELSKVN